MAFSSLNNALRLIALVVLLGVTVYVFLLSSSQDTVALKDKISGLSFVDFLVPIALSLLSYALRFIRWRMILKQLGHTLPVKDDLICYLSGFALTMTPGKSGETIRSAFLLQVQVPVPMSLSAFVIERSMDLFVVVLLASLLYSQSFKVFVAFACCLAVISWAGTLLARNERFLSNRRLPALFRKVLHVLSVAARVTQPKSLGIYALLGCGAWLAQGIGFYAIVNVFTQEIDVLRAVGIYCSGLFLGAVSMIPGGIGVTEGSLSWLLQAQGIDQNSALLSALLSRVCTLWLAVAIGCGALAVIIKGQTFSPSSKFLKETEVL